MREVAENPLASHKRSVMQDSHKAARGDLEMKILERTLSKICSLLVVGYGEAASEVRERS